MSEPTRICASCGKEVKGDKYICLPDPENPELILYFCSRGECDPRKMKVLEIRELWLQARGKR